MKKKIFKLEICNQKGHEDFEGGFEDVFERARQELASGKWLFTRGAKWPSASGAPREVVTRVEDLVKDPDLARINFENADSMRMMMALQGGTMSKLAVWIRNLLD
jgi:hypothetical protein